MEAPATPEQPSYLETVRVGIIDSAGRVLLLQKSPDSKNPLAYEFPGGKVESQSFIEAAISEVAQETALNLEPDNLTEVDAREIEFIAGGQTLKRKVHLFKSQYLGDTSQMVVGQHLNELGESEDKHIGYLWANREEIERLHNEGKLAANSHGFETLF